MFSFQTIRGCSTSNLAGISNSPKAYKDSGAVIHDPRAFSPDLVFEESVVLAYFVILNAAILDWCVGVIALASRNREL
jgi:hypothetical protein